MEDNWSQYGQLVEKYLSILSTNPYINELRDNYEKKKIDRILVNFNDIYKDWFNQLVQSDILNKRSIHTINNYFNNRIMIQKFAEYITNNYKTKEQLYELEGNLEYIYREVKNTVPKSIFSPSKLKFVTTTAIAWITNPKDKIIIDFKEIYNKFNIDKKDILLHKKGNIYHDKWIGKIVGCKTGGEEIKGHFKKENLGDFYNCATVNVLISCIKTANIKIFNNGKLQMTGIAKPSDGEKAVNYICNLINTMTKQGARIITNKKDYKVSLVSYKTVMINTCYELGISINREILYNIISKRYKLNTIYDADGYPGVRVEYYYNTLTTNTEFEGRCSCTERCKGKGIGEGDRNCRKISIAIFQSGSTIIAGGCNSIKPIYDTYNFINNIISEIMGEIKKTETKANILKRKRATIMFIDKKSVINKNIYQKYLKLKL